MVVVVVVVLVLVLVLVVVAIMYISLYSAHPPSITRTITTSIARVSMRCLQQ